jgi:hypothetical protein
VPIENCIIRNFIICSPRLIIIIIIIIAINPGEREEQDMFYVWTNDKFIRKPE